jgi:hypothetical protein
MLPYHDKHKNLQTLIHVLSNVNHEVRHGQELVTVTGINIQIQIVILADWHVCHSSCHKQQAQ